MITNFKIFENDEEGRNFPILEYWDIFLKDKSLNKPFKSNAFNFNIYLSEMITNKRMILNTAVYYAGPHWMKIEDVIITDVVLWETERPFTMNIDFIQNNRKFCKWNVDINQPMKIFGDITETEKIFLMLKNINKYNL